MIAATTLETRLTDRRPTLLYDDSCPMCQVYTGAFEKLGWAGRSALGQCDAPTLASLDLDRARHEIPVIDPATGDIRYGLDALSTVIAARSSSLGSIMRWPPTRAVAQPLYWFISYNRREMAGCPPPTTGFDCAPDFHRGWTSAYLALCATPMVLAGRVAGPAAAMTLATAGATFGEAIRDADAEIRIRIAAQTATAAFIATAATVGARAVGVPTAVVNVIGAAAGLHQVWRRRFLAQATTPT